MRIGLIDVDGHRFPNLPLMKLSAHHKINGDVVEWYNPLIAWKYPYDKVYMSMETGHQKNVTDVILKKRCVKDSRIMKKPVSLRNRFGRLIAYTQRSAGKWLS